MCEFSQIHSEICARGDRAHRRKTFRKSTPTEKGPGSPRDLRRAGWAMRGEGAIAYTVAVRANEEGGGETGKGLKVSIWFSAIRTKKFAPLAPRDIGDPAFGPEVNAPALNFISASPGVRNRIESLWTTGPRNALSPVSILTNHSTKNAWGPWAGNFSA